MNRKSVWIGLISYILWGVLPVYWRLIDAVDPLVILCNRVFWSAAFSLIILLCMGRLGEVWAVLRDRRAMKYLLPAAVLVTANWGVYIWAVNSGRVLDASLGYYMNPLAAFGIGVLLFRERCGAMELAALGVALAGVIISTVGYGAFPSVAIALAATFSAYGAVKKFIHVDAVVSICIETLLMAPLALAYALFSPAGQAALVQTTPLHGLLLVLAGPITAVPLMMFSKGVNDLPLSTMGFLQFVSPTLQALTGVAFLGSTLTGDKLLAFAFILAALLLYTLAGFRPSSAK